MSQARDRIFGRVQRILVDALGIDESEVTPKASLSGDLGAESIDWLDIIFRLEKEFFIKIPKGELFDEGITLRYVEGRPSEYFDSGGYLTPAAYNMIRANHPHIDMPDPAEKVLFSDFRDRVLTVENVVRYIERKLGL